MSFATTARLLKSATFRLALIYMVLFGASGAALLGFLWHATVGALTEQTSEIILAEIKGLAEQYERRGVQGVAEIVAGRVRRDPGGRTVYLLTDPQGRRLVGNLGAWPASEPDRDGWMTFELIDRDSPDGSLYPARARLFALQGGLRLLVGRDVRELERTRSMIRNAMIWGSGIAIVLSLAGGVAMSRSAARRIEAINQTSREIMTGDLSRRIPVRGSGDDFDQLAGNLNDMLDRIQALMEGLRHVSDNIAHDLRTPLARLRGRIEGLDDESLPPEDRGRLAREAAAEADGLIAMFNALLRITQIEAGGRGETFGPVDLAAVVRDVAELYEPLAQEKNLAFRVDVAETGRIDGDRDLLFQAVANLVDNAIKYTPAGGSVGVATAAKEVAVWDSGPGIPEGSREAVFKRFHRLEASRNTPGSGLGLSLVQAVAQQHGGRVELSDGGQGLRVTLSVG